MGEGANPVTYCPATVPCVPSRPDVPILSHAQPHCRDSPTCVFPWPEMPERRAVIRLTGDAPVLDNLFCFVIRYGWKQELISVRQCSRRTAISLSGMLDGERRLCSDLHRKFELIFSFTFPKFGVNICSCKTFVLIDRNFQ